VSDLIQEQREEKVIVLGQGELSTYQSALLQWKTECQEAVAASQNQAKRNYLYVYDQHYARTSGEGRLTRFVQSDAKKYPEGERHYTNEMGRIFFDLKALVLQNPPLLQVDPRKGSERMSDAMSSARVAESLLLAFTGEDFWNLEGILPDAYDWVIGFGLAWWKFVVTDGQPRVRLDVCSPFSIIPDPVAQSWERTTRLFHEDVFHVEQAWQQFGPEITAMNPEIKSAGDLLKRKGRTPPSRAFISEYQSLLPNGTASADNLLRDYVTISEFHFFPPSNPAGKVITFVEDLVAQEADWGMGDAGNREINPFIPIYWERMAGTVWGHGGLEKLRTLQRRLNVSERHNADKIRGDLNVIGAKLNETKFGGENTTIAGETIRATKMLYYQTTAPHVLDFKTDWQGLILNSEKLMQRMKELAGSRLPRTAESGKDRQLISAEDEARQNDPITNLERAVKLMLRTGLHYILDNEDEGYLARIADTSAREIRTLKAMLPDLVVSVVSGSAKPRNRLANLVEKIEVVKALESCSPNARRAILELTNLAHEYREADPEWPDYDRAKAENAAWEKGEDIEIHPLDKHPTHIRVHLEKRFETNPVVKTFDRYVELDKHIIKHMMAEQSKGGQNAESKAPGEVTQEGGAGPGTILRSLALPPSAGAAPNPGTDLKLK